MEAMGQVRRSAEGQGAPVRPIADGTKHGGNSGREVPFPACKNPMYILARSG